MRRRQLAALFITSLVIFVAGNGLLPLLPVFALELGASSALIGVYLALTYTGIAVGTLVGGWLSDRLGRRKPILIIGGSITVLLTGLMGQVTSFVQLVGLSVAVWFGGGLGLAAINVLAGLSAGKNERGRMFGILGSTVALGSVIGGLTSGPIADRWGFPALFLAYALMLTIGPTVALLLNDDIEISRPDRGSAHTKSPILQRSFLLLFSALVLSYLAFFMGALGRPLAMVNLGFDNTAISSVVAVAGAATLPLPLLGGWLSDRSGRKVVIVGGLILTALGMLVLVVSTDLWHFWVSTILVVNAGVSLAVGLALATDLVPARSLGAGVSLINSTVWVGAIVGFTATGAAIQILGMPVTFTLGALFPLVAVALVAAIRTRGNGGVKSGGKAVSD